MKRRHAATVEPHHEQSDDDLTGSAAVSSEIASSDPASSASFSDLGDFDLAGMAARVAASFAQSLHGNSLVYSSRASSSAGSKHIHSSSSSSSVSSSAAPSWTPPAPADHASAGGRADPHRRLALVQRHDGVFRLPAAVVAARSAEHRPVTQAPGFLNAPTAPLVAGNPKAIKRAAEAAAAAAAPSGAGAAKERGGKSAGAAWFHMTAPTLTAEVKADLKMVALRGVLDPKRHYKKDKSLTKTPQFFQLGTVVAGAAETYSARLPKAQRRQRLVDEILADAQHRTYIKRRYMQIQDSRQQDPTKRRFKTGAVGGEKLAKRKKEFQ